MNFNREKYLETQIAGQNQTCSFVRYFRTLFWDVLFSSNQSSHNSDELSVEKTFYFLKNLKITQHGLLSQQNRRKSGQGV